MSVGVPGPQINPVQQVTPAIALTPIAQSVPEGEQGFVPAADEHVASAVKDVMPQGAPLQHVLKPEGGAKEAPTQHCSPE